MNCILKFVVEKNGERVEGTPDIMVNVHNAPYGNINANLLLKYGDSGFYKQIATYYNVDVSRGIKCELCEHDNSKLRGETPYLKVHCTVVNDPANLLRYPAKETVYVYDFGKIVDSFPTLGSIANASYQITGTPGGYERKPVIKSITYDIEYKN